MNTNARRLFLIGLAALTAAGCRALREVSEVGASVAAATGVITEEQAGSIKRSTEAVGRTFESITPEQEYYIGRTVAATILNMYQPYAHEKANDYVNVLGQALALFSDRPETFGGYRFLILDTDEINAFAAPGGFILVSRGLLRCCPDEDAVAAVLAHEIAHVQHRHGLQAIRRSRLTSALMVLASESAKNLGGQELAELTKTFEGAVQDITATLVNSGYSRSFERQADATAIAILRRAGYDPNGLTAMLNEMARRQKPGGPGFARTHPDPSARAAEARRQITGAANPPAPAQRRERFAEFAKSI